MSIPPAWHPDPTGRNDHRWWDGTQWTEHVANAGVAAVDTLDADAASDPQSRDEGPGASAPANEGEPTSPGSGSAWMSPQGESGSQGGPAAGGSSPGEGWGAEASAGTGWSSGGTAGAWPTPGQSQGQAAGWGTSPQATQAPMDGMAVSSLIVGLVSLGSVIFILGAIFFFGGIGGVVAVVLGAVGLSRIKKSGRRGRGLAITGLVTGILAIVGTAAVWVIFLVLGPTFFEFMGDYMAEYEQCMQEVGDEEYCEQILEDSIEQEFFGN